MERKKEQSKTPRLLIHKASDQTLAVFCEQLSTLLASGLSLPEAIRLLAQGAKAGFFQRDLNRVAEGIETGYSFSAAAATCPESFPKLFVEMVDAAELSGSLTPVLGRLSEYYDRQAALHAQILQVTLYPIIVLLLSVTVLVILMAKVVPIFVDLIESMSGEIPFMTRILVTLGDALSRGWPLILLLIFVTVLILNQLSKTQRFSAPLGKMALKLPLIGTYILDNACMQLAQNLSILLKGGVNLPEALRVCAAASSNGAIAQSLQEICRDIIHGQSMVHAMEKIGLFPQELCQMVRVGEESGALKETMDKAADYYLKDFTRRTKLLMTLLEPAILIFVGLLVLLVLAAVMQPIYQIYELYTGVV